MPRPRLSTQTELLYLKRELQRTRQAIAIIANTLGPNMLSTERIHALNLLLHPSRKPRLERV